jgi:hypothetical protein
LATKKEDFKLLKRKFDDNLLNLETFKKTFAAFIEKLNSDSNESSKIEKDINLLQKFYF